MHSNWLILWIFFIIYGISLTTLSLAISAFFSSAYFANFAACIVWAVSFIPYLVFEDGNSTFMQKFCLCLSPNVAMIYCLQSVIRLERIGDGLTWANVWDADHSSDGLNLATIMAVLLLASVSFWLLTLYVDRVFCGVYGLTEPWYFPFTREFWCGTAQRIITPPHSGHRNEDEGESQNENVRGGIYIENLRKVFPNGKVAVTDLSLHLFEGQITVLLGPNGAGKSTTLLMLTGMLQPTSGTAFVNGYDIRYNAEKIRSSFGLCTQNNILFDELTVNEHILFYSQLKGLCSKSAENEARKYVDLLHLEPEKRSSALSGGMKRKLSLAIALCGGSKFVLCDEPSSGMDPTARRDFWKVLQSEKMSRTILLTTHYMDEADVLGDRIAM